MSIVSFSIAKADWGTAHQTVAEYIGALMILALYNFKLRLYSEISLENSVTKDWVSGEEKTIPGRVTVQQRQVSSLPQVLRAAKLKNQPSVDRERRTT